MGNNKMISTHFCFANDLEIRCHCKRFANSVTRNRMIVRNNNGNQFQRFRPDFLQLSAQLFCDYTTYSTLFSFPTRLPFPSKAYTIREIESTLRKAVRMKQDRFLLGILIGIGVLVVLALGLFFTRQDQSLTYGEEDSPAGVTKNYLVAVFKRDYERAYSYLADKESKPTFDQFKQAFLQNYVNPDNTGVDVGEVELSGNQAYVTLYIQYGASDPFSSGYRNEERAVLVKQNGAWKIEQMPPYNFWSYDWYPLYTPLPPKGP